MNQAPYFRVRYSLGLAIALCVMGPVLLAVGLLTHNVVTIVIGGLDTGIGLAMAMVPYITITGPELALRNMLGMTMRRAKVADDRGSPSGFSIQKEGRLLRWDDPEGQARSIKISRFASGNEDFEALAAWLRTGLLG